MQVTGRLFLGVSHIPKAILWEQLRWAAAHNLESQEFSTYTPEPKADCSVTSRAIDNVGEWLAVQVRVKVAEKEYFRKLEAPQDASKHELGGAFVECIEPS
jgi:hypothetical protein